TGGPPDGTGRGGAGGPPRSGSSGPFRRWMDAASENTDKSSRTTFDGRTFGRRGTIDARPESRIRFVSSRAWEERFARRVATEPPIHEEPRSHRATSQTHTKTT